VIWRSRQARPDGLAANRRRVGESRPFGSLDFEIDYSTAPGFFVGSGEHVECVDDDALNAITAFNDCDGVGACECAGRVLKGGMITLKGVVGPVRLATCRFHGTSRAPEVEDFSLSVTDAAQTNVRGMMPQLLVVVRPSSD
jgi:hypothetical protein